MVFEKGEQNPLIWRDADLESIKGYTNGLEGFKERMLFWLNREVKKIMEAEAPPEPGSPDEEHLQALIEMIESLNFDGDEFTTEEA